MHYDNNYHNRWRPIGKVPASGARGGPARPRGRHVDFHNASDASNTGYGRRNFPYRKIAESLAKSLLNSYTPDDLHFYPGGDAAAKEFPGQTIGTSCRRRTHAGCGEPED